MAGIIQRIKKIFFEKAVPLIPGFYSYTAPPDGDFPYRLHLRIEQDGLGLLIINASTVLPLNQTATEFAYHLIQQTPRNEVLDSIIKRYQINYQDASNDYDAFINRINTLITTPDLDPVTYLDFDRQSPYSNIPTAPYRLDCALTYKLFDETEGGLSPVDRVTRELSFQEWESIIKKSWQAGIPHIIFTGGEPTIRPDLVELLQVSEDLGQVTGLLTNGLRLTDIKYLDQILNAGLDHLLILFDYKNEQSWEVLRDILPLDIHTTVHMTITEDNQQEIMDNLPKLLEIGLENISLSSNKIEILDQSQIIRDKAAELGFNLVWDLPVPYSRFNPVTLETQSLPRLEEGAIKGWLYVEPDGDVLPTQSINKILGNMVEDSWETIWDKAKQILNELV